MAGKPKKIVFASDSQKFSDGVKKAIIVMANELEVPMGVGMGLTKVHFASKGKTQSEVTVEEFKAAKAEIVGLHRRQQTEKREAANDGRSDIYDRMPAEETREKWDLGRWKGMFPIRVLVERYPAGDLTTAMLDALGAELKAKKAADAAVVDERLDPDTLVAGKAMSCAAKRHSGANPLEAAGMRNKVERADDGSLRCRTHPGTNEKIVSGDFLRLNEFEGALPSGVIRVEEAGTVIFGRRYCAVCREEAYADFRAQKEAGEVARDARLTFYTVAGLRILAQREGGSSQSRGEEAEASRRSYGGTFASRKGGGDRNWKVNRGSGRK